MNSSNVEDEKSKEKSTGKRASWRTNLLLAAVVTIVMIALFELGLRIADYNPMAQEPPQSIVELRMQTPHSERIIDVSLLDPQDPQSRVRIDSRSYIMPSFQYDSPDVTIAFLGGSTTECKAVKESLRFPALVSDLLGDQGFKVNTLNSSRGGNTLHDSINVLLNHVVYDRPDIVVVMNVANDVGVLAQLGGDYQMRSRRVLQFRDALDWLKSAASQNVHLAGVARQALVVLRGRTGKAEPRDLVDREQRTDPEFAVTVPHSPYERRLRTFVGVARGLGITPVLMTQPLSGASNELTPEWADRGSQAIFNDIVRQVGAEEQVLVIDLVQYLNDDVPEWEQPTRVFYDGIHVTDYGSEMYAKHIAERLLPLVRQQRALQQASGMH